MLPVFYEPLPSTRQHDDSVAIETLVYAAFPVIMRVRAIENAFALDWQNLHRRPTKAHISSELLAKIIALSPPDVTNLIQKGLPMLHFYRDIYVENAEGMDCLVLIETTSNLKGESVIVFGPSGTSDHA